MTLRLCVVVGTRPEAIKLAPVVMEARRRGVDVHLLGTGQHREMLHATLDAFGLTVDADLDVMVPGQSLAMLTSRLFAKLPEALRAARPDWVLVQGDTTTVFAAAVCAFYEGLKVAHVEAGLRTHNLRAPFPEEANRRLAAVVTTHHFAATEAGADNLRAEGVAPDRISVTGNTVVDALLTMAERREWPEGLGIEAHDRLVLVTGHRRENFGAGLLEVCRAIRSLAEAHPDVKWLYPVHPNPNVVGPVREALGESRNILLCDPLDYPQLVAVLSSCEWVLTDSGGIQEEAPALGKPVLVTREVTERPEAVAAGGAILVGTDRSRIESLGDELLRRGPLWDQMAVRRFPYGDGRASGRILDVLMNPVR